MTRDPGAVADIAQNAAGTAVEPWIAGGEAKRPPLSFVPPCTLWGRSYRGPVLDVWRPYDRLMRFPAPHKKGLKWKLENRTFCKGGAQWDTLIEAGRVRLEGPGKLADARAK